MRAAAAAALTLLAVTLSLVSAASAADSSPPTITVTRPLAGQALAGWVGLRVTAADDVGVTRVDYYVDGTWIAYDDTPADFGEPWNTRSVADGIHVIVAVARDAAGNVGASAPVSFTTRNGVGRDTSPPTVTVVSPREAAVVAGTTPLAVVATDNVGVKRVDFYVDDARVATDVTPPDFADRWDTRAVADGAHTLIARATDAEGNVGASAPVTFAVANGAPAPPTPVCRRPYSDTSPWNTPIGAAPAVHADSSFYVSSMTPTLTSDPTQYTYPVYYADASTPAATVTISGLFSNVTDETTVQRQRGGSVTVPIPAGLAAAAGSDAQAIVLDPATGDEWGFWRLSAGTSGGFRATNGYHYNTNWSGVPPTGFGSRGAGVPYLAGLVRPCEIAQGHIDHALAFAYDYPTSTFVYPATKSDGRGTLPNAMPEGARLQLDPSLTTQELQAMGVTGPALVIARALQRYGMYIIDNSGREKLMMEYEGTAHWSGLVTASTTSKIPLSRFRWVDSG